MLKVSSIKEKVNAGNFEEDNYYKYGSFIPKSRVQRLIGKQSI